MLSAAISASPTLIPFGYARVSSSQRTVSPLFVVVAAIDSTTVRRLVSGLPRQFWVMWQNCSATIWMVIGDNQDDVR